MPNAQREIEVHIRTQHFNGDVERDGSISIQDKESRDFVLLSAKPEEVDDLINLLQLLKEERVKHGYESPRK